jgi:hypothetical protein
VKIIIAAPSYKRANGVDTLAYLPSAKIYVDEREATAYRKNYPKADIVAVASKYQGNLCRIRNKILDDHPNSVVCIVDDDLQHVSYFERNVRRRINTEAEFKAFLYKYTVMALDMGVRLWGINVNCDKQCYREYTPFSFTSYIGGPFMVHIRPELRFDERLPLKEDYDFTLQNLNKYRRILRINKFYYIAKQVKQAGGCAAYRTMDREKEQLKMLQAKWGAHIIGIDEGESRNHRSEKVRAYDINPILRVPIHGI